MPAVAAVSASGPAPRRPACSNNGAKAMPGGRPTHQGHRARHHAEQRVLAEAERDGDAGEVLYEAEERRQHQEDQHLDAAHPEQGQAGAHADGGEEGDAQGGLKRGVELDTDAALAEQHHQQREAEPADHGRRDVEPVQPADPLLELDATEVDQSGQAQGLKQVELDVGQTGQSLARWWVVTSMACSSSPSPSKSWLTPEFRVSTSRVVLTSAA